MTFIQKKKLDRKVTLLVRCGKVKTDFKLKAFFNVPEFLSFLKISNMTLPKLLEDIDLLTQKYYSNTLLRIFVIFEKNQIVLINNGFCCTNLILNLSFFDKKKNLIILSSEEVLLYLFFIIKNKYNKTSCIYDKSIIYLEFKKFFSLCGSFNIKSIINV